MADSSSGARGGIRVAQMDPARPPGLFSPRCAACGKDRLKTLSGKHSSANAGFCPACGVFVGFECAGRSGWLGWKKTCPTCGGRLRENTLLLMGSMLFITFGVVMGPMMLSISIPDMQQADIERGWMDLPSSGPADLGEGRVVKVAGTVAGEADEPISSYYESVGDSGRWAWNAHDFSVNTTSGPVRIKASLLDDSRVRQEKIIGSDMGHAGYRRGSGVVVVGRVNGNGPNATVEPYRIAPSNDALLVHDSPYSFPTTVLSLALIPLGVLAMWRLIARYRSHRAKVADFGMGREARPLGSVEELTAVHKD